MCRQMSVCGEQRLQISDRSSHLKELGKERTLNSTRQKQGCETKMETSGQGRQESTKSKISSLKRSVKLLVRLAQCGGEDRSPASAMRGETSVQTPQT